jgi:chorismate synthase
MRAEIETTIHGKNTLGGVLEIVALNVPVGLGSFAQWDKRLEAKLAMAIMSVQAIKGVEVGDAFANARLPGTQVHDGMTLEHSNIHRSTNRAGGTEGGVSNGQPIILHAAMKPIATTLLPQPTVDLASGTESPTKYERSDFCPVPRAVPILEAMVAFVLADALIEKLGGDSMSEMKPRFESLRKAALEDLQMDNTPHIFWE